VGFCAYTLFGYPLLLGLLARARARPVRKSPWPATVSIILPVYNGERFIAAKLESILALEYPAGRVEILVVSDGSTDRTESIVREFEPRANLHFLDLPRAGKAAALNAALARATGEILFLTDVRQQLDPRSLAAPLPPGTLNDDMCLPLGAFFQGYRVIFEESALAFDYPTQLASEFRRKVRTLAGVYQVMKQYPALLGPGNRMWIHFFSHKLARLIMPWAMLAAAMSSLFLPHPWNWWAIGVQAAGYALALLDPWLPERFPLKRISSPARTFTVLMAASLCAVSILFVPARLLWRETRVSATRPAA